MGPDGARPGELARGNLANELRRNVEDFEPSTGAEQALYTQSLERIHDLDQAREIRLLNAREGLPPILWFVLVSLEIDTVLFTYFVGMKTDCCTHAPSPH